MTTQAAWVKSLASGPSDWMRAPLQGDMDTARSVRTVYTIAKRERLNRTNLVSVFILFEG